MATVHVFVGQCGNQLGAAFLDALASEAEQSGSAEYEQVIAATHFRPAFTADTKRSSTAEGNRDGKAAALLPQPRCVMVDMEPKVIEQVLARVSASRGAADEAASAATMQAAPVRYALTPQQCVTRGEGSGNNWAYGYMHQGRSRRDAIAACLRRENEAADAGVAVYHVVHGVAGGTGSGVGSLVAEVIKDAYPHATLLHSVVWPFESGEVVTQWYNLVLAMRGLRDCVDAACVLYNDTVRRELMGRLAHRGLPHAGLVDYAGINATMSRLLTPLHSPQLLYDVASVVAPGQAATATALRYACMQDIVETLALDPGTKFFSAAACPAPYRQRALTADDHADAAAAEVTTWPGVLQEAARVSWERYDVASAFASTASSSAYMGSGGVNLYDTRQRYRCCLWALRGGAADSDGLHAMRRLFAPTTPRSANMSHGTASAAAAQPSRTLPLSALLVSPVRDDAMQRAHGPATRSDHEVTLYGPSSELGTRLTHALRTAETLLHAGAFVHHFERYGVEQSDLQDAIATMWDTAMTYGATDEVLVEDD